MKTLVPRRAARALLALTVVLAALGPWTAALPVDAGGQAERVVAQALPGGEQVVQPGRQPLSPAAADRRGDLDRARSVLLGILVGAVLLGAGLRWWGRRGPTSQHRRRATAPACASRAPPGLRTA